MTALRALHATRNAAGLSEDDARSIYLRVVGESSTRAMTDEQRHTCRREIIRLYPSADKRPSNGVQSRLEGKYAAKLQSLWIAGWNLGIVHNRRDEALISFVKGQTGIDHTRWLRHQVDAAKAIEGLKKWLEREGGVDWRKTTADPKWYRDERARVAVAQFEILQKLSTQPGPDFWAVVGTILKRRFETPEPLSPKQWILVMNTLGHRVRAAKGKSGPAK